VTVELRRVTSEDLPRLRQFWSEHWGGAEIIVHGEVFRPEQLQGFVAESWAGIVTYIIVGDECEIISLDSLQAGRGIGTALINGVVDEARRNGCRRVCLSTTNDNLGALGFYQRRGFELVRIRRGAIDESRRLKPGIPLIGENRIRIRDEVELELPLRGP
jgi:ribosomal protein S18 acetylase RimI-like enzyme